MLVDMEVCSGMLMNHFKISFKHAAKTAFLTVRGSSSAGNPRFGARNQRFFSGNPCFSAGNRRFGAGNPFLSTGYRHFVRTSASCQQVAQGKPISEIPGPTSLPLLGSLFYFLTHKEFDKEDLGKIWKMLVADYGPIVKVKLAGKPLMVLSLNPDDVETLIKTTMDNPVRMPFNSIRKVRLEEKNNFFNQKSGLLTENGEEWWRVRSRVQVPLLRPRNVSMYLPQVDAVANQFMDRLEVLQQHKDYLQLLPELHKWALESIALVALNTHLGGLNEDLPAGARPLQLLHHAQVLIDTMTTLELGGEFWYHYFPSSTYRKMQTAHDGALAIAVEAMEQAELRLTTAKTQSSYHMSIMEILLTTEGLSRSDVTTMVLDLLLGGIETTALTVGFALYLLARNQELQEELQQKVDAVVKRNEPLTPEHIAALTCISHVVKETLRLYPPASATARLLTRDTVLSGYCIPAGTFAAGLNGMMSRMEEYFPRPLEFLPQRWQRDRPYGPIHPFASLPFSHGTRMCIGKRLAEQEIYTFLIRVLQRYKVTYEREEEMVVTTKLVTMPVTPFAFKFHPRH